jgi:hypothetical protein
MAEHLLTTLNLLLTEQQCALVMQIVGAWSAKVEAMNEATQVSGTNYMRSKACRCVKNNLNYIALHHFSSLSVLYFDRSLYEILL